MAELRRATRYVRDESGRVILKRGNGSLVEGSRAHKQPTAKVTPSQPLEGGATQRHLKPARALPRYAATARKRLVKAHLAIKKYSKLKKVLLALGVLAFCTGGFFLATDGKPDTDEVAKQPATQQTAPVESLEYQTILPNGKSISQLGGWKRVSPLEADPVYAYIDSLAGVEISVSQQPMPGSFIKNIDASIAKLAKEYSATSVLNAGDVKAYIGVSSKGPQSTIFTKNNLLILIKSQKKIEDKDWVAYIESLN